MFTKNIIILAIESSCDDTSVSIMKNNKVLSNVVSSQKIHKNYGGVYPEIAARIHQKNIVHVVDIAIQKAKININQVNAIAFTLGPGLIGSLLVGVSFAKSLSIALDVPIFGVDHIHAHVFAHFIKHKQHKPPSFPFLCLTISGGHTQLILVKNFVNLKLIGNTIDDPVGETLDKCGKIMGLSYPSGPIIEKHATKGNPNKFWFCKPKVKNFNFSFSGFKTNFLYFIQRNTKINKNFIKEELYNICASLQKNITYILLEKVILAVKKNNINKVALSGGVSVNNYIKKIFIKELLCKKVKVFSLCKEYTTDNAAMIAMLGQIKLHQYQPPNSLSVVPFSTY